MRTALALLAGLALPAPASPQDPRAALDELLATDRGFAAAAARTGPVAAIAAMLADDVTMPLPGGGFAEGREAAVDALRSSPANAGGRIAWSPVRGGISADARHGFTFGYMTATAADGSVTPLKYLAYWVRGPDGWRVAAYKRRVRPAGEVPLAMLPPALPDRLVEPVADEARLGVLADGLARAEQAFSDDAQRIGLRAAFERYGSADAMNMGGPDSPAFVLGPQAIARAVSGEDAPRSPVSWSADRVLVAASGDLGITFGIIRLNEPVAGRPSEFPFFTIWRRSGPDAPWRYVAE